jgi:hypothetical protein
VITDLIFAFFADVVGIVLGLLPVISPPSWLGADGAIATVLTYAGSMGAWFPAALTLSVISGVFVLWGIGFTIKVVRIVASFLTMGGGSAA